MKDGQTTAIILVQQNCLSDHISYQLEIHCGAQILHYHARYSELHKLFSGHSEVCSI